MKNLKQVVKDVERDLVINITLSVRYGRINLKEARQIAKEFMAGYPYKNKKDLFKKVDYLSDKFKMVRKIYVKYVPAFKDEESKKVLKEVRKYMRKGEVEEAIVVAKGGIYG